MDLRVNLLCAPDGPRVRANPSRDRRTVRLTDLMRHVRSSSEENGPVVEILLERADRILAKDGGRNCKRVLTDAEIDLLLAGDEAKGAG